MGIVGFWFQRTLKQPEREQTDRQTDKHKQTDTQDDYSNPRACAPRVNEVTHLGHVLSDTPDIVRAVRDICQFHSLHISVSNLAWFCSLYASALSSSSDLVRIVYFDVCYRDFSSVHELDIVFFYQTNQVYICSP